MNRSTQSPDRRQPNQADDDDNSIIANDKSDDGELSDIDDEADADEHARGGVRDDDSVKSDEVESDDDDDLDIDLDLDNEYDGDGDGDESGSSNKSGGPVKKKMGGLSGDTRGALSRIASASGTTVNSDAADLIKAIRGGGPGDDDDFDVDISDDPELGAAEEEFDTDSDSDSENENETYLQKFDEKMNAEYLNDVHPECVSHNFEEIALMSQVVRENGIIVDPLHRTAPILTKYETARILGQRAKQIESGSTPYISVPANVIDSFIIAERELMQKKIPFIIKRPLPGGGVEYWRVPDLEIIRFR